jgi:hypothetical protein
MFPCKFLYPVANGARSKMLKSMLCLNGVDCPRTEGRTFQRFNILQHDSSGCVAVAALVVGSIYPEERSGGRETLFPFSRPPWRVDMLVRK